MATTDVTLKLPRDLVRDARELGVLSDETVSALLRAEVDRRVMDVVNEEIRDYRAEKNMQRTAKRKPQ